MRTADISESPWNCLVQEDENVLAEATSSSHIQPHACSVERAPVWWNMGVQGTRLSTSTGYNSPENHLKVIVCLRIEYSGDPCWASSKESACHAGDAGSVPGSGRSPAEGNGNPLQYSCLENPMDRGAWWATVHGVTRVGYNLVTKPSPPEVFNIVGA